ncbi:MAG: lysophospholipid acyltransferase family protein [Armatimonadota bacterium]|nr:lysophospholipid acyltransferase family protein [Armatimonadota bacterium]
MLLIRLNARALAHRILFNLAYVFFKLFFGIVFRFPLFVWLRIEGRARVPRRGGLIIVANHLSLADPPVLWYAAPRHLCFVGRADIPNIPLIGAIARLAKTVPIRQRAPDRQALKLAIETVQSGEALVIFPEGELSESGDLQPFLPGVLLILRQTRAPVLPVGIIGTDKIMPYGKLVPKPAFGTVVVRFGEVIPAERILSLPTPEAQLEFLEEQVARLSGQRRANARIKSQHGV